jgi:hypothetical protein
MTASCAGREQEGEEEVGAGEEQQCTDATRAAGEQYPEGGVARGCPGKRAGRGERLLALAGRKYCYPGLG